MWYSEKIMHIFIIAAVSADGFIACDSTQKSTNWTSREDLVFFSERTKQAGACVMGATTFATIGRPLPGRVIYVLTNDPTKFSEFNSAVVRPVSLSPAELSKQVVADGFSELAVCGGASVYAQYLEAGVVDELFLTYEPIIFGKGISLFATQLEQKLQLTELRKLNDNAVLHKYKVVHS